MTAGEPDAGMAGHHDIAEDIAERILRRIAEGDLPPGTRLPPLLSMATSHHVSIRTVQRGVRLLQEAGFVRSVPDHPIRIAHEVPPVWWQQVAGAVASGEPLDTAAAAAFEIIVHGRRTGSAGAGQVAE